MMFSLPCFMDYTVLVNSMTRCTKTWETVFAVVGDFEFLCVVDFYWKLFRMLNDGIIIGDYVCGWVKKLDGG